MFLVPFRSPTSSRGPLPIFRNYFFGHSGSPGNLSNSGPLPPHLPQTRASRPGYPARPIRSASGPPWLSLPAPSSRSGPGLGQEFAWWARARSEVGVFCARAPPRPARRGGGVGEERRPRQGGLGRAGPRLLPASRPGLGLRAPRGAKNWSCFSLHRPERLLGPHLCRPRARTPWAWRGGTGPRVGAVLCTLRGHLRSGALVCSSVKWEKASLVVDSGRELIRCERSV